ncbi:MAG: hypothetical protein ABFD96_03330 [Armatimonadia bacterium]
MASNATLAPRSYYGQIQIDAYFCVLAKGVGKVPYDANQHRIDERRTAIDIDLMPLPEQNVQYPLRREAIAESREWAGVIWPSLKALGLTSVRQAHGAWVKMQQVPSGRKYHNRQGEEKEATTFKFLALYPDEAACRAAYLAETGRDAATRPEPAAGPSPLEPTGASVHDVEVAKQFIKAFAKQKKFDIDQTRAACANQSVITKAVDINSPEFVEIITEAMTSAA